MSLRRSLLAFALVAVAQEAAAVPAFARRYEVACSYCHNIFPKLNRAGERFKERGFRLENEEKFESSAWLRSVPISGRILGTRNMPEGREDRTVGYLKALSAGNLGSRVSYWVDDAWLRTGGETFHVEPDNSWVRVDFRAPGKLYAKAGRFELDLPFSQTRTPHLLPYSIYGANAGLESDTIGAYQEGVELGGEVGTVHLSAAVVKGRNNASVVALSEQTGVGNPDKFDGNLFLRASKRGVTTRFGAFAYIGRNELVARIAAGRVGVAKDDILRLGIDGNAMIRKFHVYGLAMYGRNGNALLSAASPSGTNEALSIAGGFLATDYYLRDNIALTARVQTRRIETGPTTDQVVQTAFLPGVQVVIWKLKVSGQWSLVRKGDAFGALQIETAF